MNKTQIIQRVAFSTTTNLPKPSTPEPTETDNTEGFKYAFEVALARICQETLVATLFDLSETPDATLLRRLHDACQEYTERCVGKITIAEHQVVVLENGATMLATIAEIARELGIEYKLPKE